MISVDFSIVLTLDLTLIIIILLMGGACEDDLSCTVPSFAHALPILLVDQDISSLKSISLMLQRYSFNVTTAQTTSVAMAMIQNQNQGDHNDQNFKLVMAHLSIQKPEDLSFLRAMVLEDIPLILISSDKDSTTAEKALAAGVSLFLEKPISLSDLKHVWQHACQRRSKLPLETKTKQKHNENVPLPPNSNNFYCSKTVIGTIVKNNQPNFEVEGSCSSGNDPEALLRSESSKSYNANKRLLDNRKVNDVALSSDEDDEIGVGSVDSVSKKVPGPRGDIRNGITEGEPSKKNSRIVWTNDLHRKFTEAVSTLGDRLARPKMILQLMKVPNLTQRQVASHLQKYKSQVEQVRVVGRLDKAELALLNDQIHSCMASTSYQGFDTKGTEGSETFGFSSRVNVTQYPPVIGPSQFSEYGNYLYQDTQQRNWFPKQMEPGLRRPSGIMDYAPISILGGSSLSSWNTNEQQFVNKAGGRKLPSPMLGLTETGSPVPIGPMEFSDLTSVLSPMQELSSEFSMDLVPLNLSQNQQDHLSNIPTGNPALKLREPVADIASGFILERVLQTDLPSRVTLEEQFIGSSGSANSREWLRQSNDLIPSESTGGFDELQKILEEELVPNPESKVSINDLDQCSKLLEELIQAPAEVESDLLTNTKLQPEKDFDFMEI